MNYDDVHFGQSDNNYFYNPHAGKHIHVSRYVAAEDGTIRIIREDMTLDRWRALSGYDGNSKEFSYLDQFDDITIDTRKDSRIVYNASLDVVSMDLGITTSKSNTYHNQSVSESENVFFVREQLFTK